uniref:Uncharacterized protein n=1 Tax=Clandestinovirus TaxID=2831644 RepID=A0A8F8KT97_9VIRU|nr:hypothetical protein KOM_12_3 [Clandestinovirus]
MNKGDFEVQCSKEYCTEGSNQDVEEINVLLGRVQRYLTDGARLNNDGYLTDPHPAPLYRRSALDPNNIYLVDSTGPIDPLTKDWDAYKRQRGVVEEPNYRNTIVDPNTDPEPGPNPVDVEKTTIDDLIKEYSSLENELKTTNQKILIDIQMLRDKLIASKVYTPIDTDLKLLSDSKMDRLLSARQSEESEVKTSGVVSITETIIPSDNRFKFVPSVELEDWVKSLTNQNGDLKKSDIFGQGSEVPNPDSPIPDDTKYPPIIEFDVKTEPEPVVPQALQPVQVEPMLNIQGASQPIAPTTPLVVIPPVVSKKPTTSNTYYQGSWKMDASKGISITSLREQWKGFQKK